ncbi:hypothetical protein TKK_0013180 [Trichogramma kaykai]|uniref:RNA helicase n=1 Tax=Trichogramma kaykai TaxID=54128 RepID=A0ABD2WJU3_9HYME
MGKKKGFNARARSVANIEVDDSTTKNINLDLDHRQEQYDACNALVLPNEKRKTKNKDKPLIVKKLLSKKKRKLLEKVLERKGKKENRAKLLEELAKVSIPQEELQQYSSLVSMQTKGLRKHKRDLNKPVEAIVRNETNEGQNESIVDTSMKGARKRRLALLHDFDNKRRVKDPNVLGLEESSESESDSGSDSKSDSGSDSKSAETENIEHAKDKEPENKVNEKAATNDFSAVVDQELKKNDSKCEKKIESANEKKINKTVKVDEKKIDKTVKVNEKKKVNHIEPKYKRVNVVRNKEIEKTRINLPVVQHETDILETINENPVVIIKAATGSGKSTQVPQFLYEAGYATDKMIAITQPRRVAAISMSERVAEELCLSSKEVSYLIRFEGNANPDTKIKFMTDGVLLKEVQNDRLLRKYSVIILDEAHERSVHTDVLIGLLSRIVFARNKAGDPLKLIIMSATMNLMDFLENGRLFPIDNKELFPSYPLVKIEVERKFKVIVHHNRITPQDDGYIKDAIRKAVKVHTQHPTGGILIFLTGKREINTVVRQLRKAFPYPKKNSKIESKANPKENDEDKNQKEKSSERSDGEDSEDEFFKEGKKGHKKTSAVPKLLHVDLDKYDIVPPDDDEDEFNDSDDGCSDDETEDTDVDLSKIKDVQPMRVLPFYSSLPRDEQAKVFEKCPNGYRTCVVATNIAETSLTIPGMKYVIDSGKTKKKFYDKVTGVSTYRVTWCSKASAQQRTGRVGRTADGDCYRLYSSAVFNNDFPEFDEPEIVQKPVDDIVLFLKLLGIDAVGRFPFPTPIEAEQLRTAEERLKVLGAIQASSRRITELGRSMAAFPVSPRYGKMLALSHQSDLLPYTICMVAALSVPELFVAEDKRQETSKQDKNKWMQTRLSWARTGKNFLLGDAMVLIRAVGEAEFKHAKNQLTRFCQENGLSEKAMTEIRKLRQQLTKEINMLVPNIDLKVDPSMPPPTEVQAKLLRQIVLSGTIDQVARKLTSEEIAEWKRKNDDTGGNAKWKYAYKTTTMEDPVFMHVTSVLRASAPEWVVYQELYEPDIHQSNESDQPIKPRTYMRGITAIEPEWLPKFATLLCNLNDPMPEPEPRYDETSGQVLCHIKGTFGRAALELPLMEVEHPKTMDGIKWFARFLLEGQVFPKLKKYKRKNGDNQRVLLTSPSSMTKSWAKLLPRVQYITNSLMSKGIMSRDKLKEEWCKDPTFLLSDYQKWLPESCHSEVELMWPPV